MIWIRGSYLGLLLSYLSSYPVISMKYLLILILCFACTGCKVFTTTKVLSFLGAGGLAANKYTDYKLTKRSLNLKEEELDLKREDFEYRKEAFR